MKTKWLLVLLPMMFGNMCAAAAQVADVAGPLPGDR
jgi:hypothetical protein